MRRQRNIYNRAGTPAATYRENPYPSAPLTAPTEQSVQAQARPQAAVYTGSVVTGVQLLHKQAYAPMTSETPRNADPKRR